MVVIDEMKKTEDDEDIVFSTIEEAVDVIKRGGMVIVMDDESRENEGDLIMAADAITAKQCAFIIRYTTGILCAPMSAKRAKELDLPRMVKKNQDPNGTAFTVTCDSIRTTTGVSAADRATTFRELADDVKHKASSFSRPGHVFPLIAKPGGVLQRRGHTEAAVDLCTMAGRLPVGVIGELTNDDGTMKRLVDCARFAREHDIPLITVEEMVRCRLKSEKKVGRTRSTSFDVDATERVAPKTISLRKRNVDHVMRRKADLETAIETVRAKAGCLPVPMLCVVTDRKGRIVMTNDEFIKFTGYSRDESYGYNCNFLQGKDTDPDDIADIRSALDVEQGCSVVLLNYTKAGERFWNVLSIRPLIESSTKQVSHYVGNIITIPIPVDASRMVGGSNMDIIPQLHLDDVLSLLSAITTIPLQMTSPRAAGGASCQICDDDDDDGGSGNRRMWGVKFPKASKAAAKHVNIGGGLDFVASTMLPTNRGRYRMLAYRHRVTGAEPLAIVCGRVSERGKVVPVRVHDQCLTSEVFGSLRCDCQQQLHLALEHVRDNGTGAVLYLPQEGRGIGIANKIAAYHLQEHGFDTVDANRKLGLPDDAREYDCVGHILKHLEIEHVALLTNNPRKIHALRSLGINVVKRVPCVAKVRSKEAKKYLKSKIDRMGHVVNDE
eukprot:g177.t1